MNYSLKGFSEATRMSAFGSAIRVLVLFVLFAAGTSVSASAATSKHTVVSSHPRLLLTPSVLSRMKAKAAAHDPDWRQVKKQADELLTYAVLPYSPSARAANTIYYNYEGFHWLEAFQYLGLAYQVTGKVAYAKKVMEVMDAANAPWNSDRNVGPISVDNGFPSRSAAFGLALAYDWVYDQLDATRKAQTVATLNAWYDWYTAKAYKRNGPPYNNYFNGHILGFGCAGLATAGDNDRSDEILSYVSEQADQIATSFTRGLSVPEGAASGELYYRTPPITIPGGFASGYPVESFNYGPGNFLYMFQYMLALRTATGTGYPNAEAYAKVVARSLLHTLKPNRWQTPDEGDFPGNFTGVLNAGLPLFLTEFLDGTTEGRWMQFFLGNLASVPYNIQDASAVVRLMWYEPARPAEDYRKDRPPEPLNVISAGDGHLLTRSSWNDDAVWASFKVTARIFTAHQSMSAGHLAIQRGNDYLLVNSGQWKGVTGVTGSPQAFDRAGWRMNTLFFDDLGEYMYKGNIYTGGQGYWGGDNIIHAETTPDYVYASSDLTDAYDRKPNDRQADARTLRSFIRNYIYVPGTGDFVVYDRIKALKDAYIKKLYWHFNPSGGVPMIGGTVVTSTVGASAITLATLLPATPVIAIEKDGVKSYTDTNLITYRAAVADNARSTDVVFLTAINARHKKEKAPAASAVDVASLNMAGAEIDDKTPFVVLFSSDGSPQKSVEYRAKYTGVGRHIITGMVTPGVYDVTVDGANTVAKSVPASSQGVLSFTANGAGGRFSIVYTGKPPSAGN